MVDVPGAGVVPDPPVSNSTQDHSGMRYLLRVRNPTRIPGMDHQRPDRPLGRPGRRQRGSSVPQRREAPWDSIDVSP